MQKKIMHLLNQKVTLDIYKMCISKLSTYTTTTTKKILKEKEKENCVRNIA